MEDLIRKYNVPAPRYTSYPTVPMWEKKEISTENWLKIVKRTFDETNSTSGISLYIHLPFCESLCTYCGCNKRITKNHDVEGSFIETVLKEWKIYVEHLQEKPIIRELHLGGGTPTFFSAANLKHMLENILKDAIVHPEHDFSFEGHPNNTKRDHLQTLFDLGFKRVSYGVQDLDFTVQKAINRIQPFKNVKDATDAAREIGYTSVNFDLIYGLPFQTAKSIEFTMDKVAELMPDRIAFYSYAHVPWKSKSQRGYSEANLPDNEEKRGLYEFGWEKLLSLGYRDIGMDHFALPEDSLTKASENGTLHRNFMGYTTGTSELLIGLGNSAISDAKYAYMQNEKVVEKYKECIGNGELATFISHTMTDEDLLIRKNILKLLCTNSILLNKDLIDLLDPRAIAKFQIMQNEGLLNLTDNSLIVTEKGIAFIRNIAMVLDLRLNRAKATSEPVFSKSI